MQNQLDKLRKISSTVRYGVLLVLLLGLSWTTFHFITLAEYRAAFDANLGLLWSQSDVSKVWLLLISMPTLLLFLTFAWYFQHILLLFSKGEFFSEKVISSFKIMLWTKVLGLFSPIIQTLMYGYLAKQMFGEGDASLRFNLWEVFTVVVLFTIFYLLNGARQIEQENKEFI